MLFIASFIWGCAFVAQRVGADNMPPCAFLAVRNWVAVIVMSPVIRAAERMREKRGEEIAGNDRKTYWLGGLACGFSLFISSVVQQIGIGMTTTAKAGFLTAMYVVIVPVIYAIIRRKSEPKIWISVAIAVAGLYLLCMRESFSLEKGDLYVLGCAFFFSFQIISVSYFVKKIDGMHLSRLQFFFTAVFSTIWMLLFEHPTKEGLLAAVWAILYTGILSSGVAYTMQILGQRSVNPAAASLIMSLESVFAAIAGWVVFGQALSFREITGCVLMFAAIVIAELPSGGKGAA